MVTNRTVGADSRRGSDWRAGADHRTWTDDLSITKRDAGAKTAKPNW